MWRTAIAINSALCFIGSSPLTWRLLCVIRNFTSGPRIISTYVENTLKAMLVQLRKQDHLHIRGEHLSFLIIPFLPSGSSPHTWRTLEYHSVESKKHRIISTYVENTDMLRSIQNKRQDHLHIRGEHSYSLSVILLYEGSSPHTWRILLKRKRYTGRDRIISTYVENTFI